MSTDLARPQGTLAISPEQTDWTEEQKQALASAGVTDDCTVTEARVFLHRAQISGLDPFSGQIHLVGRWDNRLRRKVFRPQTGIDGLRLIGFRTGNYGGQDDPQWCGPDGEWRDVWLDQTPPAAARVVVHTKDGGRFPAIALWSEYAQKDSKGEFTPMWKSMPSAQLRKCAEALALRSAFPHDTAGLYIPEEMERADAEAEAEEARLTAAALSRKQYIAEEQATAQLLATVEGEVVRDSKPPEDDPWASDAVDGFEAQQKAAEDETGIPATEPERIAEFLARITAAETPAVLSEVRRDAGAQHRGGRLDEPSWAVISTAISDRAADLAKGGQS